jgi:dUTPase
MKLFIKKIDGLVLPTKANALDAGYDIVATSEPNIVTDKGDVITKPIEDDPIMYRAINYIEYGTNLYWAPDSQNESLVISASADASGSLCGLITKDSVLNWHIELFPRSSISKYNLVLANGVGTVDTGYRNQVMARFKYIFQPKDFIAHRERDTFELVARVDSTKIYQKGDKIMQLKPRLNVDVEFELIDELPAVDSRGLGGFGSSGGNSAS